MMNHAPSQREEGLWYKQCTYHGKTTVTSHFGKHTRYENTILTLWCNHGLNTKQIPHFILDVRNQGSGPISTPTSGLFTVWVPHHLSTDQVKHDGNTITFVELYKLPPLNKEPVTFTFHFQNDESINCYPPVIGSSAEEKMDAILAILMEVMK
jgi:hypothetical protein